MRSLIVVIALLTSCIANATDIRPLQSKIAWSNKCLPPPAAADTSQFLPVAAAVAAIVGPKIVAAAVDSAATALKNAGKDKEVAKVNFSDDVAPYALTDDGDLVIPPDMRCLDIVWGELGGDQNSKSDYVLAFQARVDPVKGATGYFRLTPIRLSVGQFAKSSFFSHDARNYTISLSLSVPGADKPFASTTFMYQDVAPGTWKSPDPKLSFSRSDILAFPPVPDGAKKAQTARNTDIAPYVIAADIIKQSEAAKKKPPFPAQPSVYAEDGAEGQIKTYCDALKAHNKGLRDQFALNDDLCAHEVATAKKLVTAQMAEHGRSGKNLLWANEVCAYGKQRNLAADAAAARKGEECPAPALDAEAAGKRYGVMTTSVTITEVRPGSDFAETLGNILSSSKDDLSKELSTRLIPSLRQAAEAADDASDRSARRGIQLAELKVQTANDLLAEAIAADPVVQSDISSARAALFQAKAAANDAYRLAGQTPPYPEAY